MKVAAAAAGVLAAGVLAGCHTDVNTAVAAGASEATVTAVFTDTGTALNPGTDAATAVAETFRARTGTAPDIVRTGNQVRASVRVPTAAIGNYSDLTGVADVSSTSAGGNRTVVAHLVRPTGLESAIVAAAADEPSPTAVAAAMRAATTTTVAVTVDHGAEGTLSGPGTVTSSSDGTTSLATRSLSDGPATFTVVSTSGSGAPWGLLAAAAALAAAVAVVSKLARRKR